MFDMMGGPAMAMMMAGGSFVLLLTVALLILGPLALIKYLRRPA